VVGSALVNSDVQGVWRAAHFSGAAVGLDAVGMARLRLWTAERMRNLPYAVFDSTSLEMRPSFNQALSFAAIAILNGGVPE
jgi:hypothetical protein